MFDILLTIPKYSAIAIVSDLYSLILKSNGENLNLDHQVNRLEAKEYIIFQEITSKINLDEKYKNTPHLIKELNSVFDQITGFSGRPLQVTKETTDRVNKPSRLYIPDTLGGSLNIETSDIVYFENEGNYTKVYFLNGNKINSSYIGVNISQIEKSLLGFIRISSKHLINTAYILEYKTKENRVLLKHKNDEWLSVSKLVANEIANMK